MTPVETPATELAETPDVGRSANEFWSIDSAPKQFSHRVPQWRAPLLLIVFSVLALGALWALGHFAWLRQTFPHHDLYFFDSYQGYYTVSIRVFILCYFVSFALFMDRRPSHVLALMADLCLTYLAACVVLDATAAIMYSTMAVALHVHVVAILSGIMGFAVFSFKLLERGRMPERIGMEIDTTRNWETMSAVMGVAILCAGIAIWVSALDLNIVEGMRDLALLGGIGPGVFLFLPSFFLSLYILSSMRLYLMRKKRFCPPLTIIVPAHNEEYIIGRVIEAVDKAAQNYDGPVHMLIGNNNSTDDTQAVAERALADCDHVTGVVFAEPRPGKSFALNSALAMVETEFMIRVDADTIMAPDALVMTMRHFKRPDTGVVGGLPIPPGGGPFDRARALEAVVKHGFYSVGMGVVNGVVGIPGMLAAYRTKLPQQLGGFVGGMNGEDTDMSLRIGELGYALVVDPEVRYVSEVPATYAHMREQRMRWFRSIYHISSRCRDMIFSGRATVRGKLILPYMLINSGRRAMIVPLILFGLIEYFGGFHTLNPLEFQAVLAVTIGAPALVATFAAIVNGQISAIIFIPEYLLFRILRAYFTLESMLSISIKAHAERLDDPLLDWARLKRAVFAGLARVK